jgi:hypothetical protein
MYTIYTRVKGKLHKYEADDAKDHIDAIRLVTTEVRDDQNPHKCPILVVITNKYDHVPLRRA